jgi:hypothetical protein
MCVGVVVENSEQIFVFWILQRGSVVVMLSLYAGGGGEGGQCSIVRKEWLFSVRELKF